MEPSQAKHNSFALSPAAVLSLIGYESNPNPDDPEPSGPWGPVIRRAAERVLSALGPSPQRLGEIFGPVPDPWRSAFAQALAQEVIDRTTLMQEVADALPQLGNTHGIIIIGGFLSRFIDDCGTGKIRWKLPPPRHHGLEGDGRMTPRDLVVIAAEFERSAAATDNEGLRREFSNAGARLLDIGVGRLQPAAAQTAR